MSLYVKVNIFKQLPQENSTSLEGPLYLPESFFRTSSEKRPMIICLLMCCASALCTTENYKLRGGLRVISCPHTDKENMRKTAAGVPLRPPWNL